MSIDSQTRIQSTEMHTAGEPLRIVESGYPEILGETLLEKRRCALEKHDHLRKFLMFEPRGHYDMYGALLVRPDHPDAHLAVLFMHNAGYSTMCGHAIIALGRYAVDRGLVTDVASPETTVNIQCPCGLVRAFVEYNNGKTGRVRFHSVPAFAYALDVSVDVPGYGTVDVDIGYGGAFYAIIPAASLGLDLRADRIAKLVEAGTAVKESVMKKITIKHSDNEDLAFLYGTILTDGRDAYSSGEATTNLVIFADREVDKSPCGSGVTARVAVQHKRGLIGQNKSRVFESAANGSQFTGMVVKETHDGNNEAVIVEVCGNGYYSGSATFTAEEDDQLRAGFLVK